MSLEKMTEGEHASLPSQVKHMSSLSRQVLTALSTLGYRVKDFVRDNCPWSQADLATLLSETRLRHSASEGPRDWTTRLKWLCTNSPFRNPAASAHRQGRLLTPFVAP